MAVRANHDAEVHCPGQIVQLSPDASPSHAINHSKSATGAARPQSQRLGQLARPNEARRMDGRCATRRLTQLHQLHWYCSKYIVTWFMCPCVYTVAASPGSPI